MTLSFSRGLDKDRFDVQITFDSTDFGMAFPDGSTDPDDVFFRLMGPNFSSLGVEAAARLTADFAKIVQTAIDAAASAAARALNPTLSTEAKGLPA